MAIKKSELYSSLWASCDELRGGMDASQYKDYVLVLLFVKYVSDKYAGVPYAPITIPEGASFKDMVALKGKPDIGDQINKKIIGPLANANKLSDMPDFNDPSKLGSGQEIVDRLTNLISIFENKALDFSKNRADGDDILGDAYEYLMRHFAAESGKSKGQFYTPAEVSRIMARIIGIHEAVTTNDTTVYDPTCGSGLRTEAGNPNRSLYDNNKAVYSLLRYGVQVQAAAGENTETVWLIDWNDPAQNDFALAEEVTLHGNFERRPDLVLYLNGIAIGVVELKNSRVSIGNGIRQNISNQQPEFNAWFFSTVQFVFAGSDSEGLQYGTIGTGEKYFLTWKEDEADNSRFKLDKYLLKMCNKARLIELMHDFVLFDGGIKKLPRVHQYFGIKAAQGHVHRREGGIIWHTQGSGKSIVMVLLAKWILENKPNARVVIVTDRDELDKQIEGVFIAAG
jgi:type I site-specific restriction-modification system R (restriction) subunit